MLAADSAEYSRWYEERRSTWEVEAVLREHGASSLVIHVQYGCRTPSGGQHGGSAAESKDLAAGSMSWRYNEPNPILFRSRMTSILACCEVESAISELF